MLTYYQCHGQKNDRQAKQKKKYKYKSAVK